MSATARAAEHAARASYGRILALLVARNRDIAAAEDALADAFLAALQNWPQHGVPSNPDAWLLIAARNQLINQARHRSIAEAAVAELAIDASHYDHAATQSLPDRRLALLFVCAHPAIDESMRTPLMLQTVLGLDAARIAAAFLLEPATMAQRLVRTKAKIKDAGLRFEAPSAQDMPERLAAVLNAIYAAYGTAWDAITSAESSVRDLDEEALFLGRLLVELLPKEPEARGLLALMLYCQSRREARRDAKGAFVPLNQQDIHRWSRDQIVEAEQQLTRASRAGVFGRFQCEAAIQSLHAQRAFTGHGLHQELLTLYSLLAQHFPSVGVYVGWAAALIDADQAQQALSLLQKLEQDDGAPTIGRYQPYWATLAHALGMLGLDQQARAALQRAMDLTKDPAVSTFLATRMGAGQENLSASDLPDVPRT